MTTRLFDTHVHLNLRPFDRDRDAVIARARAAGVVGMINVGFDTASSEAAVALAATVPGLYAACGVHPHYAAAATPAVLTGFEPLLGSPGVVALGEIGLDYYRDLSPRPIQREVFCHLLDLARRLALPVIIHDRDAHGEVLEVLRAGLGERGGVMHCFSGDRHLAVQCLDLGMYISVAGPITYAGAQELREVARLVPADRLLVETDCPWLAPMPRRGKRNEPALVSLVAEEVARLRGVTMETIAGQTTDNACRLFGVEPPGLRQSWAGTNL
jgi:TatD DNase family protein